MFLGGAVGLIIIAVLKFVLIGSSSFEDCVLGLYYLLFGIVTGLIQLGFKKINNMFRFINYHWGECIYSFFLASLSFSSDDSDVFIQIIVSVYFMICGIAFLILCFWDRENDRAQAKKDEIPKARFNGELTEEDENNKNRLDRYALKVFGFFTFTKKGGESRDAPQEEEEEKNEIIDEVKEKVAQIKR